MMLNVYGPLQAGTEAKATIEDARLKGGRYNDLPLSKTGCNFEKFYDVR